MKQLLWPTFKLLSMGMLLLLIASETADYLLTPPAREAVQKVQFTSNLTPEVFINITRGHHLTQEMAKGFLYTALLLITFLVVMGLKRRELKSFHYVSYMDLPKQNPQDIVTVKNKPTKMKDRPRPLEL